MLGNQQRGWDVLGPMTAVWAIVGRSHADIDNVGSVVGCSERYATQKTFEECMGSWA